MKLRRGEIYTADLNPRFGTEAGKVRPVLVIQTDFINEIHPSTLVCPLTTKVKSKTEILRVHLKEGEAGLDKESDVMIDQIRSIDNGRFKRKLGSLNRRRLEEVEEKIKIVLDLPQAEK